MSMNLVAKLIKEYYVLDVGVYIEKHTEIIEIHRNIKISRKSIKHIVEQRMADKYTIKDIILIFYNLISNLETDSIEMIVNKKDTNSILILEKIITNKTSLVIVADKIDEVLEIKTGFFRASSKVNKLKKQK